MIGSSKNELDLGISSIRSRPSSTPCAIIGSSSCGIDPYAPWSAPYRLFVVIMHHRSFIIMRRLGSDPGCLSRLSLLFRPFPSLSTPSGMGGGGTKESFWREIIGWTGSLFVLTHDEAPSRGPVTCSPYQSLAAPNRPGIPVQADWRMLATFSANLQFLWMYFENNSSGRFSKI